MMDIYSTEVHAVVTANLTPPWVGGELEFLVAAEHNIFFSPSTHPWLGIPLEPHPSLVAPESEFPLPVPEFRKIPAEKCRKKEWSTS